MLDLIRAFIDIALWRRGPQHLPYSVLLFLVTLVVYCMVSVALTGALKHLSTAPNTAITAQGMLLSTAIGVGVTLAWVFLMLAVARRAPRFFQTSTAVFGASIVITPLLVLAPALLMRAGVPIIAWSLFLLMLSWYVIAIAHIVRNALDVPLIGAVLLTCGFIVCLNLVASRVLVTTS
jgi:hypothetical protein